MRITIEYDKTRYAIYCRACGIDDDTPIAEFVFRPERDAHGIPKHRAPYQPGEARTKALQAYRRHITYHENGGEPEGTFIAAAIRKRAKKPKPVYKTLRDYGPAPF